MSTSIQVVILQVSSTFYDGSNGQVLLASGVEQTAFWNNFDQLIHELT